MSIPNVSATLTKTSTVERAGSGSMIDPATQIIKLCYQGPSLRYFRVCIMCVCVHQMILSVVGAWVRCPVERPHLYVMTQLVCVHRCRAVAMFVPVDITYCNYSTFTAGRLENFVIQVSQPNPVHICALVTKRVEASQTTFSCAPGVAGRIVKIRMTGNKKRTLALYEVRVFGMLGESIKLCTSYESTGVKGFYFVVGSFRQEAISLCIPVSYFQRYIVVPVSTYITVHHMVLIENRIG